MRAVRPGRWRTEIVEVDVDGDGVVVVRRRDGLLELDLADRRLESGGGRGRVEGGVWGADVGTWRQEGKGERPGRAWASAAGRTRPGPRLAVLDFLLSVFVARAALRHLGRGRRVASSAARPCGVLLQPSRLAAPAGSCAGSRRACRKSLRASLYFLRQKFASARLQSRVMSWTSDRQETSWFTSGHRRVARNAVRRGQDTSSTVSAHDDAASLACSSP